MPSSISVIVPCHSHKEFLPLALASIQAQTSTVEAVYLVLDRDEAWASYAPEIKETVIEIHENLGVSHARNCGIERALRDGHDWVICLDEDDELNFDYARRLRQAEEAYPDADIFYPDWTIIGTKPEFSKADEYNYDELINRPYIISTAAISTDTWKLVKTANGQGYDENLHALGLRWEDYLFYLEAGFLGAEMARIGIGGGLVRVRRHEDKGSGSDVANATIPEWVEYVAAKFQRLYSTDLTGLATGLLWPT